MMKKKKTDDQRHPEDRKFLKKLKDLENEHYHIKDIQRFLKRRINDDCCTFLYNSTVSEVNVKDGHIKLTPGPHNPTQQEMEFDYLVLADGNQRNTAKLLSPSIQYRSIQGRPEKKHVMAYLTVKSKDDKPINNPLRPRPAILADGDYCGFIYHEQSSLEKHEKTTMKLCVFMHVSDELFEKFKSDKISGTNYLTHCVESVFDKEHYTISMTQSQDERIGPEKDRLKYSAFILDFQEAVTSAFETDEHTVILAGDTRRSSDFYLGHGGNDAIQDGILASEVINQTMMLSQYNEKCKQRSEMTSSMTEMFQPIRSMPEKLRDIPVFHVAPYQEAYVESQSTVGRLASSSSLLEENKHVTVAESTLTHTTDADTSAELARPDSKSANVSLASSATPSQQGIFSSQNTKKDSVVAHTHAAGSTVNKPKPKL